MSSKPLTKSKYLPTYEMLDKRTHPIIELFFEFAQLKNIYRRGWLQEGRDVSVAHCESGADHSFGVGLLSYFVAEEYRPDLDSSKAMRLGLFHELGESRWFDATPHDNISAEEKRRRETEAVIKSLSVLRNPQKYLDIWLDFEYGKSPEAIFVKQIDHLEMALQANLYEHLNYTGLEEFFPYVQNRLESPELKDIFDELLKVRK